ncbi:MAG TPA: ATP-binding protein, partial [Patescibacteria group bacterium]|nr:ATP-binding protein [Patescibacteria group bacterium]
QPMEDGFVVISRASGRVLFPSKFILFAAQNPCPCGYFGDPSHDCKCMPGQVLRYHKRVSGPMLDRIDIHLDVPAVKIDKLTSREKVASESSKVIQKRVQAARNIQTKRFKGTKTNSNAEMTNKDIKKFCELSGKCLNLLKLAVTKMQLSARSYQRIIKLSRTIADLETAKEIKPQHIAEALQYRPKIENSY